MKELNASFKTVEDVHNNKTKLPFHANLRSSCFAVAIGSILPSEQDMINHVKHVLWGVRGVAF